MFFEYMRLYLPGGKVFRGLEYTEFYIELLRKYIVLVQSSCASYNRKSYFNIFVAYFSITLKGEKCYPPLTIFKCLNTILYIIIQYFHEHNNVFSSLSSYLSLSPESREPAE